MTKQKLSPAALICILLCARSFTTMTLFPVGITGGLTYMTGAVISTVLQIFLLIPAAKLAARASKDPCTLAFERGKNFGRTTTLAFLLYFIYEAFRDIGDLAYFTDYFFAVNMTRVMTVLCVVLTAVYAARLRISVLGRTARITFAGVIIMLAVIAAGAAEDMDITRFDCAVNDLPAELSKVVYAEFSRCECLALFSFLAADIDGDPEKTAKRYLIAKGAMITLIAGMVTSVLGTFAFAEKLPVFTLAAASENLITERSDAVFLLIWVMTGIVKLTTLLYCSARCLRLLLPKTSDFGSVILAGFLPTAAALPLLLVYGWEKVIYSPRPAAPIIVLGLILPAYLLHVSPKSTHEREV
jgi:hypothetical protein